MKHPIFPINQIWHVELNGDEIAQPDYATAVRVAANNQLLPVDLKRKSQS